MNDFTIVLTFVAATERELFTFPQVQVYHTCREGPEQLLSPVHR
jgi:hypothetical protein